MILNQFKNSINIRYKCVLFSTTLYPYVHCYSFNAITTIGVGNIDGGTFGYTCLVVAFVIIGLAVITMCVDLASTQVKVCTLPLTLGFVYKHTHPYRCSSKNSTTSVGNSKAPVRCSATN